MNTKQTKELNEIYRDSPSLAMLKLLSLSLKPETSLSSARILVELQLEDKKVRESVIDFSTKLLSLVERAISTGLFKEGQYFDQSWLKTTPKGIRSKEDPVLGVEGVLKVQFELLERKLIIWDYYRQQIRLSPERIEKIANFLRERGSGHDEAKKRSYGVCPVLPHGPTNPEDYAKNFNKDESFDLDCKTIVGHLFRLEKASDDILKKTDRNFARREEKRWWNYTHKAEVPLEPRQSNQFRYARLKAKYGDPVRFAKPYEFPIRAPGVELQGFNFSGPKVPYFPKGQDFGEFFAERKKLEALQPSVPLASESAPLIQLPAGSIQQLDPSSGMKLVESPFFKLNCLPFPKATTYVPQIEIEHPDIQKALDILAKLSKYFGAFRKFERIAQLEPQYLCFANFTPEGEVEWRSALQECVKTVKSSYQEKDGLKRKLHGLKQKTSNAIENYRQLTAEHQKQRAKLEIETLCSSYRSSSNRLAAVHKAHKYNLSVLAKLESVAQPKSEIITLENIKEQRKQSVLPPSVPPVAPEPKKEPSTWPAAGESIKLYGDELTLSCSADGKMSLRWRAQLNPGVWKVPDEASVLEIALNSNTKENESFESFKEKICSSYQERREDMQDRPLEGYFATELLGYGKIQRLENIRLRRIEGSFTGPGIYNFELAAGAVLKNVGANEPGVMLRLRGTSVQFEDVDLIGTAVDISFSKAEWRNCHLTSETVIRGQLGESRFDSHSTLRCEASKADFSQTEIDGSDLQSRLKGLLFRDGRMSQSILARLNLEVLSAKRWEDEQVKRDKYLGRQNLISLVRSLDPSIRGRPGDGKEKYDKPNTIASRASRDRLTIPYGDTTHRFALLIAEPEDMQPCQLKLETYQIRADKPQEKAWQMTLNVWSEEPIHYHRALFEMMDLLFGETFDWPGVRRLKRKDSITLSPKPAFDTHYIVE